MLRTVLFPVLLLVTGGLRTAAAQAAARPQEPAAAPTVDPAGVYDFDAVLGNGSHALGRLVVKGQPGHYEGTIAPDGSDILTFSSIDAAKDTAVLKVDPPSGAGSGFTFHLKFEGASFGGWFVGDESGQITGKRVR